MICTAAIAFDFERLFLSITANYSIVHSGWIKPLPYKCLFFDRYSVFLDLGSGGIVLKAKPSRLIWTHPSRNFQLNSYSL
jgi:hypothetical protein